MIVRGVLSKYSWILIRLRHVLGVVGAVGKGAVFSLSWGVFYTSKKGNNPTIHRVVFYTPKNTKIIQYFTVYFLSRFQPFRPANTGKYSVFFNVFYASKTRNTYSRNPLGVRSVFVRIVIGIHNKR